MVAHNLLRSVTVIFCLVVLILYPSYGIFNSVEDSSLHYVKESVFAQSYTPHDPIVIRSNHDFEMQALNEGWGGNGSESNPFRIEGYSFSSGFCIDITDTDVYFVIINCLTTSSTTSTIYLANVDHGRIVNTVLNKHSQVSVLYSSDIQFDSCELYLLHVTITQELLVTQSQLLVAYLTESTDCSFTETTVVNFHINRCTNMTIEDCSFYGEAGIDIRGTFSQWNHRIKNNTFNGKPVGFFFNCTNTKMDCSSYGFVLLGYSENITLHNGNFSQAWRSVSIYESDNCSVANSSFSDGLYSINIDYSNSCIVSNTTHTNMGIPIDVYSSSHCRVFNSTFYGEEIGHGSGINAQPGSHNLSISNSRFRDFGAAIRYSWGSNLTVDRNQICHCDFGIKLYNCNNSAIFDNHIGWNSNQAQDDRRWDYQFDDDGGYSNNWDDCIGLGNYWTDSDGEEDYHIPGTTESVDRYPRVFSDTELPTITGSRYPTNVTSEDSVVISANAKDNYGIDSVLIWISDMYGNQSMVKIGSNWTYTIYPKPAGIEINYRFYACDWAGNWGVSDIFRFNVSLALPIPSTTTTYPTPYPPTLPNNQTWQNNILLPAISLILGSIMVVVLVLIRYKK